MTDLQNLYQEVIIDHGRRPRNFGQLEDATHQQQGVNPLCGDQLTVYLIIENNVIKEVKFDGCGCAISVASSSLMSQAIKGKPIGEVLALFDRFHAAVTDAKDQQLAGLGKLAVLAGVAVYPARVKCATLAWHALKGALLGQTKAACTE